MFCFLQARTLHGYRLAAVNPLSAMLPHPGTCHRRDERPHTRRGDTGLEHAEQQQPDPDLRSIALAIAVYRQ